MHRVITSTFLFFLSGFFLLDTALDAQETAARYFERVSERYETIQDYSADLVIQQGEDSKKAKVWYKAPGFLRLDFSVPEGMVMAVSEENLQVWVPAYGVTFTQPLRNETQGQLANLASARGLELMQRYYVPSYVSSPEPEALDEGSSELVVKLELLWKSSNEGFEKMELSIDSDLRIRRIVGQSVNSEKIVFDFTQLQLNQGIPNSKFQYESPPSGNTITNFLFDSES